MGNYNKEKLQEFMGAISAHVADPDVEQIVGTFRRQPVIHYYRRSTGLDVMTDMDGQLISIWKLNEKQAKNVEERGSL